MEATGPAETIADDMTLTLMLALERLSPLERATFLLHDVFDMALRNVAQMLDRDAAAVRQLAVRARRNVQQARTRYPVEEAEADRIARAFFAALRDGDTAASRAMLAEDVLVQSDDGGRVLAFRNNIHGVEKVLRLFAGLARKPWHQPELLRTLLIDGFPGYTSRDRGKLLQTTAPDIRDGHIVRNPDKLRHVAAALGL